ncbi:hypothetical protein FGIG_12259 [Fasciola gigantica]|uniref:Uncharacterized protein n=1 Tax=Fasciola gigantica TaxID=46835 RepID=A0A504YCD7_FASGI|nr:hypothetical protein FGIG_12259 [Fasciola gigantica]
MIQAFKFHLFVSTSLFSFKNRKRTFPCIQGNLLIFLTLTFIGINCE